MVTLWVERLGAIFLFLALVAAARVVYFAYFYAVFAQETNCADLPAGSVVLALGFEHLGEEAGAIQPGQGNLDLARRLAGCAERLSLVVTQKAVSDALAQEGLLAEGKLLGHIPVRQMHPHRPGAAVRTFRALEWGLKTLDPLPDCLVLLAHDKQIERAYADLRALFPGRVILWQVKGISYARPGWFHPLRWAWRELFLARPAEYLIRAARSRKAR